MASAANVHSRCAAVYGLNKGALGSGTGGWSLAVGLSILSRYSRYNRHTREEGCFYIADLAINYNKYTYLELFLKIEPPLSESNYVAQENCSEEAGRARINSYY